MFHIIVDWNCSDVVALCSIFIDVFAYRLFWFAVADIDPIGELSSQVSRDVRGKWQAI